MILLFGSAFPVSSRRALVAKIRSFPPGFACAPVFLGTFQENRASSRDRDRTISVFEELLIDIGPTLIIIVVVAVLVNQQILKAPILIV